MSLPPRSPPELPAGLDAYFGAADPSDLAAFREAATAMRAPPLFKLIKITLTALLAALAVLAPAIRAPETAGVSGGPTTAFSASAGKLVYLVPMGGLEESDVVFIARGLERRLGVGVALLPPQPTPKAALRGGQYSASGVMDHLFAAPPRDAWRTMAITADDLTSDDVDDMVYGFASSGDAVAVISTYRFAADLEATSPRRRARARDQLVRAAVHEIGHTTGMHHCATTGCLMGEISHRDQITPYTTLCARCAHTLAANLETPRDLAAEALTRGDSYLKRGNSAAALAFYTRSIDLTPEHVLPTPKQIAAMHNRLGATLLSLEHVAEGERYLRNAVAQDPTFAPAHYNMALVYAYAGDAERAVASLKRGATHDKNPRSRYGFAARFYLDALDDIGSALISYRAFVRNGGADPYLEEHLAPLDHPNVYVFTSDEAGVILGGQRRKKRKVARVVF